MNIFKYKIVVFEKKTDSNEWKFVEFIEDNNKWSLTTCGDIVSDCRFLAHYNRQNAPESVGRVYEPLFCTGLNDKNGKLIFEGDIVKFKHSLERTGYEKTKNTFEIVTGYVGRNEYNHTVVICDGSEWHIENATKGEIIGNIYENKELLKEQK